MFDYRYHALSLAAVLFALALGVLIGVAIGDTNLVSSAKSGIVHNLNAEVGEARKQSETLQERLSAEEAFSHGLYPLAVHELLNGRSIGLVFLGDASDEVNSLVKTAVTQGDGTLATVVAVRDAAEPDRHRARGRRHPLRSGQRIPGAARTLRRAHRPPARQRRPGSSTRSCSAACGAACSAPSTASSPTSKALVVERSPVPAGISAEQAEADSRFEAGLIAGVSAAGVRAVGVELTSAQPSQIPWFKGHRLSSVDNLDQQAGQAALLYALAGYSGSFGVKATADSLLPTVNSGTSTAP